MNMRGVELQLHEAVVAMQTCPEQGLPENLLSKKLFCVSGSSAFWELLILNFMLHSDTE